MSIPNALGGLSLLMDSSNIDLNRKVPKLLASICCISEEAHTKVLEALNYKAKKNQEKHRFHRLIRFMSSTTETRTLINYLIFVNVLVNMPSNVEIRSKLREEFIQEGIETFLQVSKKKIII